MLSALARPWRRRLAVAGGLAVAAVVVLAPWTIRNYLQFSSPIVTTTHGGYTLLRGNNPIYYDYLRSSAWGAVWDSTSFDRQWRAQQQQAAITDEVGADRLAYATAWQNIRRQPLMFAYACAMRVAWLWGLAPHQVNPMESTNQRLLRYAIGVWYAGQTVLALIGCAVLARRLTGSPWVWGLLLAASFTLVHTLYWTDLRMRAPLISVVALAAAAGTARLAAGKCSRNSFNAIALHAPR
jgi:hypothetical protein